MATSAPAPAMPVPSFMASIPHPHPHPVNSGGHSKAGSSPPKAGSSPPKPAYGSVPTAEGAAAAAAARAATNGAAATNGGPSKGGLRPPHRRRKISKDMQRTLKAQKSGGGGKGMWGRPGDELLADELDEDDPNYDPDEADTSFFKSALSFREEDTTLATVKAAFLEYFDTFDSKEVFRIMTEHNLDGYEADVVVMLVSLGMDMKGVERELVSLLLAELNGQVFTPQNIQRGFDLLLDRAEDLQVDTPQLIFLLARFLARAVADEAVPPKYIAALQEDRSLSKTASATVEEASILLTMKHGLARLSEIWGVGGGRRPVVQLGRKMHLIIQEYLSAHDLDEAQRCLHELDVPHFHHELVYDSVVMAIEGTAAQRELILELLQCLANSVEITSSQITAGFERVYANLGDLSLDVPNAPAILAEFVDKAIALNVLTPTVASELPERGRKRMLSTSSDTADPSA